MGHREYLRPLDHLNRTRSGILGIIVVTVITFFIEGAAFGRGSPGWIMPFALVPADVFGRGWIWQLVTHLFLHDPQEIWHVAFNMLFLYWFGREIEAIYGTHRFLLLYFGAGLLGGVIFAIGGLYENPLIAAMGASGAVMGVMVVAAFHDPRRPVWIMFFFQVPLALLVAFYVLSDLYFAVSGIQTGVAVLGHLGGALFGFLFYRFPPGERWTIRWPSFRRRADPAVLKQQVDAILEKITREGMGSLSEQERAMLERASRQGSMDDEL